MVIVSLQKLYEVKETQGHTAKEWRIWNQQPGLTDTRLLPQVCLLNAIISVPYG